MGGQSVRSSSLDRQKRFPRPSMNFSRTRSPRRRSLARRLGRRWAGRAARMLEQPLASSCCASVVPQHAVIVVSVSIIIATASSLQPFWLACLQATEVIQRSFSGCCSSLRLIFLPSAELPRHPGGIGPRTALGSPCCRFACEPERFSAMLYSLPSDVELVALERFAPTEQRS